MSVRRIYIGDRGWMQNPDAIATGEETSNRLSTTNAISMTSQALRLTYFAAAKTETITQVKTFSGSTAAAATPTLIRIGVYTENQTTKNLTLIASTPNDTALYASPTTEYTKAFSQSFVKTKGTRYAVGILVVSSQTVPQVVAATPASPLASVLALAPRITASVTSQADLPGSITAGSLGVSAAIMYALLLP